MAGAGMRKKKITLKTAYTAIIIAMAVMLLLQFLLLVVINFNEAKRTTSAYMFHTKTIIEKNQNEEALLMDSLKEDYIVLAKAVSYYLDNNPKDVYNEEELQKICSLMSIDEIHIFNEEGEIISSTLPETIGLSFESGEQIGYFTPMLSDKSLCMCQDTTPNTADGKPMIYAITWNEAGTQMVQVGIEPVRLLNSLEANSIQATIENMVVDEGVELIVADESTLETVGSRNKEYLAKNINEIANIDQKPGENSFTSWAKLDGQSGYYFCETEFTNGYCICVFLSHKNFMDRIIESTLIVFAYLLAACIVLLTVTRRLIRTREENDEHLHVFQSMSEIYYSLHLVDLIKDTAVVYSSQNQVKEVFDSSDVKKASVIMPGIMRATMSDEYLERGLKFTDMTTLRERMRGKKVISMELLGRNVGWIRMSFITLSAEEGLPVKIIVATQIIDEEKKVAESLYEKSHVDEMTGCYNRRAYNSDIHAWLNGPEEKDFVYMSLDVNSLKTVNDTLGHEAGDELICGAAECMKNAFSKYGKIYRFGGDEFVGLIYADRDLFQMLCEDFDRYVGRWQGNLVKTISVSYGYVYSSEAKGKNMTEIANLADKRMYESKSDYYKQSGHDRRRR